MIFFYNRIQFLKLSTRMLTKSWKPDRKLCVLNTYSLTNGLVRTTEQDTSSQFIWAFSVVTDDAKEHLPTPRFKLAPLTATSVLFFYPEAYQ